MDAKQRAAATRYYQDFDPKSELIAEEECDTLLIYLPGYRKDQIKVQLSKTGNLIISGEQLVGDNIWQRFQKTNPVSKNCDINKISAKFEDFILYIEQPKLITAAEKQDKEKPTSAEAPELRKPEESGQKPTSLTNPAEQTNETSNKSAEISGRVPGKAQKKEKEKETGDGKNKESNELSNFATKMVGGATRLKMPRKVMNLVFAIIFAVALALYVKKSVRSWYIAEN